jgi:hypothetical protein
MDQISGFPPPTPAPAVPIPNPAESTKEKVKFIINNTSHVNVEEK